MAPLLPLKQVARLPETATSASAVISGLQCAAAPPAGSTHSPHRAPPPSGAHCSTHSRRSTTPPCLRCGPPSSWPRACASSRAAATRGRPRALTMPPWSEPPRWRAAAAWSQAPTRWVCWAACAGERRHTHIYSHLPATLPATRAAPHCAAQLAAHWPLVHTPRCLARRPLAPAAGPGLPDQPGAGQARRHAVHGVPQPGAGAGGGGAGAPGQRQPRCAPQGGA